MNASSRLTQAAIILKSLPKQQAARILSRLEPSDIKTVFGAINSIDVVTSEQITQSYECLNSESGIETGITRGSLPVSSLVAPESACPASAGKHFSFLAETSPELRDLVLQDEHPRNIAIVLSMLPPEMASACMNSVDPVVRVSVLKRLCELEDVEQTELAELSYSLKLSLKKLMNQGQHRKSGLHSAAALLSYADCETQETLLGMMNQSDPRLAEELEQQVIKLDDLATLSDSDVRILLCNVDTSCWAPALKRAPTTVQNRIFENMGERPVKFLKQEMEAMAKLDTEMERLARRQIINGLLALQKEGAIKLKRPNGPHTEIFPAMSILPTGQNPIPLV